ncbi:uncharacterized protein [Engystomops pustulosus]|uniref:uncharacterized protein isoform X1 n=1 Tax=Engystomops pustulosus TaxID=76066 RepID=UPI003AFA26D5
MHGIRALILLGCSILSSSAPQEDAIANAINACSHKLNTKFNFKFLEDLPKDTQNNGRFFKYSSYSKRPKSKLQRLFPWIHNPPQYQFVLTTAWKRPLPETPSPDPELGSSNHMVVRMCSGLLTNQEPFKFSLRCRHVPQQGFIGEQTTEQTTEEATEEATEESPITTTKSSDSAEGSVSIQDEDLPDLSRCLGCIFGMLNKPMNQ